MDEGQFVESGTWLKEVSDKRGLELFQEASSKTFQRLRIVERLMSSRHKITEEELQDNARLQTKAHTIVTQHADIIKEELELQQKIRPEGMPDMKDPHIGSYYAPYDLSPAVVQDSVKWFLIMKDNNQDGIVNKYLTDLLANLYICGIDKEAAKREFFENKPAIEIKENEEVFSADNNSANIGPKQEYGDLVLHMASRNLVRVNQLPEKNAGSQTDVAIDTSLLDGTKNKIGTSNQNFVKSIGQLSGEFNQVYRQGIQQPATVAHK